MAKQQQLQSNDNCTKVVHELQSFTDKRKSMEEERWRSVLQVSDILNDQKQGFLPLISHNHNNTLYDHLLRKQPKQYISRAYFISCMQIVLKLNNKNDKKLISRLHTMYSSFDVYKKNQMDWREVIFRLYISIHPTDCTVDHLIWGLTFFRDNYSDQTVLKLLDRILCPLLYPRIFPKVKDLFCFLGEKKASKKTIDSFVGLLRRQNALEKYRLFDTVIPGTRNVIYSNQFEEMFYVKPLLDHLKNNRRRRSILEAADTFRYSYKLRRAYFQLKRITDKMKEGQNIFKRVVVGTFLRSLSGAFFRWRRLVLEIIASVEVQRLVRGHLGRLDVLYLHILHNAAIRIQALVRGRAAMKYCASLWCRREEAVIHIQRIIRGTLGRLRAFRLLLDHFNAEREKLRAKRFVWETRRQNIVATKIQTFCRMRQAQQLLQRLKEKRLREFEVNVQIELRVKAYKEERKLFEKQLSNYYENMKESWWKNNKIEAERNKEERKMRSLKQKLAANKLREDNIRRSNEGKERDKNHLEQRKMQWGDSAIKKSHQYQNFCLKCISTPRNKEERKLGKELKKQIKERTSDVVKRADERFILLEWKEAKELATREVLEIVGKGFEIKEYQRSERKAAEEEVRQLREYELHLKQQEKEFSYKREAAAKSIIRVYQIWQARKQLRHLCYQRYEKVFHSGHHAFFYRNKATMDESWVKPKALGSFDILARDQWILLRDDQGFPYYYNPKTMDMTWDIRKTNESVSMCSWTIEYSWWKIHPPLRGYCVDFASHFDTDTKLGYCSSCWKVANSKK